MRTPLRHILLVVVALVSGCKVSGCKDDPPGGSARGRRFACTCDFLTDMDDASVQKVVVCARDGSYARERAIGCAQSGAPATVQGCRCEPSEAPPGAEPCPPDDCQVAERR